MICMMKLRRLQLNCNREIYTHFGMLVIINKEFLNNMKCEISSFEEIYPIWHDKLWPGRISKIKPMSILYWQMPNKIIKDSLIFKKYSSKIRN